MYIVPLRDTFMMEISCLGLKITVSPLLDHDESKRSEVQSLYTIRVDKTSTYDHTYWKIRDPVRSPRVKPVRGGLVVGSVTTSEYPLLYVFCYLYLFFFVNL